MMCLLMHLVVAAADVVVVVVVADVVVAGAGEMVRCCAGNILGATPEARPYKTPGSIVPESRRESVAHTWVALKRVVLEWAVSCHSAADAASWLRVWLRVESLPHSHSHSRWLVAVVNLICV